MSKVVSRYIITQLNHKDWLNKLGILIRPSFWADNSSDLSHSLWSSPIDPFPAYIPATTSTYLTWEINLARDRLSQWRWTFTTCYLSHLRSLFKRPIYFRLQYMRHWRTSTYALGIIWTLDRMRWCQGSSIGTEWRTSAVQLDRFHKIQFSTDDLDLFFATLKSPDARIQACCDTAYYLSVYV